MRDARLNVPSRPTPVPRRLAVAGGWSSSIRAMARKDYRRAGVLTRAWGRGMRVVTLQFIKAKTANWGETRAAKKMGVEIIPLGDGFTWTSKDIEKDKGLAVECCVSAGSASLAVPTTS